MNETKNKQQNNAGRQTYKITIDEHPKFPATSKSAFIMTHDLCKKASEVFNSTFADYEGCFFEVDPNGLFYVTLVFNHGEYGDEVVACKRGGIEKSSGYKLLDRSRSIDNRIKHGDRYLITEDGKDIIAPLLLSNYFNNGNINWSRIVGDYSENRSAGYSQYNFYNAPQLTQIKFIDVNRLIGLIYGRKIGDEKFEYMAQLTGALHGGNFANPNINGEYVLTVTQADVEEVNNLASKLGMNMGSKIIR